MLREDTADELKTVPVSLAQQCHWQLDPTQLQYFPQPLEMENIAVAEKTQENW
jgi:hypothetical protein